MRSPCAHALLLLVAGWPLVAAAGSDDMDRFLSERGLVEAPAARAPGPAAPAPADAGRTDDAPRSSTAPSRTAELVVAAMGALGVPYRFGGNTFDSGYDCSGFVRAMYAQNLGLMLPRQAAQQAAATQQIGRGELQPGDLVFFNTLRRSYSHVGIYVGDHKFIHSPKPGAVVRIEDMRVGYWHRRFDGARRVVTPGGTRAPALPVQASASPYPELPNY